MQVGRRVSAPPVILGHRLFLSSGPVTTRTSEDPGPPHLASRWERRDHKGRLRGLRLQKQSPQGHMYLQWKLVPTRGKGKRWTHCPRHNTLQPGSSDDHFPLEVAPSYNPAGSMVWWEVCVQLDFCSLSLCAFIRIEIQGHPSITAP